MIDHKFEIIKALEQMLERGRSTEFQDMAVQLGKTKWPQIEATERNRDGGEDGTSFTICADGKRRRLAASFTATLDKVRKDARRLQERQLALDELVFFTPTKVDVLEMSNWLTAIKKEFGHDLHVIGRAEIVAMLERPENTWICRDYLGLNFSPAPDLKGALSNAREAATKILRSWRQYYDFEMTHTIAIDLKRESKESQAADPLAENPLSEAALALSLVQGRRIIITGCPGAGKTTFLLRLAEQILANDAQPVPLLIFVPLWLNSGLKLRDYIAELLRLNSSNLSDAEITTLLADGQMALLLNGWNEAKEGTEVDANYQLQDIALNASAVPLAITTRETYLRPRLPREVVVLLQPLSRAQKADLIRRCGLPHADRFLHLIRNNPELDQLTTIPFFLMEAVKLAKAQQDIPATKTGILRKIIEQIEQSPDHQLPLRGGVCGGFHQQYLARVAVEMTLAGTTHSTQAEVLKYIAQCIAELQIPGLDTTVSPPATILRMLHSHHLLLQSPGPTEAYCFVHQQFQEWFAAQWLAIRVRQIAESNTSNEIFWLQRTIIDQPRWQESLMFLMEELCAVGEHKMAAKVVTWVMPVDLVLASALSNVGGTIVWNEMRDSLGNALREWFNRNNQDGRDCAIAAMLATKSADFADLLWPILEGTNDQEAILLFRTGIRIRPTALGAGLQSRFAGLKIERQKLFLHEMMRGAGLPEEIAFAKAVAIDPNVTHEIKVCAIECLVSFRCFEAAAATIVDTAFGPWTVQVYREIFSRLPNDLVKPFESRAIGEINSVDNPALKRAIIGFIKRLGNKEWFEHAKKGIQEAHENHRHKSIPERLMPGGTNADAALIYEYVELIYLDDPEWINNWLIANVGDSLLWQLPLSVVISRMPRSLTLSLVASTLQLQSDSWTIHTRLRMLLNNGGVESIGLVIDAYLSSFRSNEQHHKNERMAILEQVLREHPLPQLTDGILKAVSNYEDHADQAALLRLLRPSQPFDFHLNQGTNQTQKEGLRALVLRIAKCPPADELYIPSWRADLALFLGAVGGENDLDTILTWLQLENERRKEIYTGRHPTDCTSYDNWYVGAICQIQGQAADKVLRNLLQSKSTIADAAAGLFQLCSVEGLVQPIHALHERESTKLADRQPNTSSVDSLVKSRADAIVAAIEEILDEEPEAATKAANVAGAVGVLAHLNDPRAVALMVRATKGSQSNGRLAQLYYALAMQGFHFDAKVVAEALEPFIAEGEKKYRRSDDPWAWVTKALAVLLHSDNPAVGVARIRKLPTERLTFCGHDIFRLLVHCDIPESVEYLLELSTTMMPTAHSFQDFLLTLAEHPNSKCHQRLAAILADPASASLDTTPFAPVVNGAVLELAKKDSKFLSILIELIDALPKEAIRPRHTGILCEIGTADALFVLIKKKVSITNVMRHALSELVLKHDPVEPGGSSYYLVPKESSDVKRKFCEILIDPAEDEAVRLNAYQALNIIYRTRVEYGQPTNEPLHPAIDLLPNLGGPWPLVSTKTTASTMAGTKY